MENLVISEMRTIVRLFHLFGIGPVFARKATDKSLKFYQAFIAVFALLLLTSAILMNRIFQQLDHSLATGASFASLFLTHCIIHIQAFAYRHRQLDIFKRLVEIDAVFSRHLKININYSTERRQTHRKIGWLLIFVVAIEFTSFANSLRGKALTQYWLHCILSATVIRLTCIQIVFYADMMMRRNRLLNERLQGIVALRKRRCDPLGDRGQNVAATNAVFALDKEFTAAMTSSLTYPQLIHLKAIYTVLYDLCCTINTTFGWSLLIISIHYFIEFTLNGYWLFLALQADEPDLRVAIDCSTLLLPIIVLLSILCKSCYACTVTVGLITLHQTGNFI